jgi:hypothetical protein
MSTATNNVLKMPGSQSAKPALNLPGPRVWGPQHLADFLGLSVHWVYKRCETKAENPIPRIPNVGRIRFDTENPKFRDWMRKQLGLVGLEGTNE